MCALLFRESRMLCTRMGMLLDVELTKVKTAKCRNSILCCCTRTRILKLAKHLWCTLILQENKRSAIAPWNLQRAPLRCDYCHDVFRHYAAHIMVPNRSAVPGYFGWYCSWNCAKRDLLRMRNRPWFALMAITALRSGAKLPIRIDPNIKDERVRRIPKGLENIVPRQYIHTPLPPLCESSLEDDEQEPEVYDVY